MTLQGKIWKSGAVLALLLVVNSAYLWAFKSATLAYMANVLLHLVLGVAVLVFAIALFRKSRGARLPIALFAISGAIGIYLAIHGNLRVDHPVLVAHIAVAALSIALFLPSARRFSPTFYAALAASLLALLVLPVLAIAYRRYHANPDDRIVNSTSVPVSMEQEGGGPRSPFWPASTVTSVKNTIPSSYFLESKKCGECHTEIYKQWQSSAHHFASFNNQYYRKSIEYMQDVQHSTRPTQWCAGCHDHAVLFSGRWKQPIREQIDTPEAQAGLACLSCHAISRVGSSMGNSDYTLQYNSIHYLATSSNPVIHAASRFLTYMNPEPHRRTFLKPFMKDQTSEYCSACHKVHLDVPVNNYRWIRGFNDYDNWQASGVSGQGARSFYYPAKPQGCADCHMPLVKGNDPASKNGLVHAHWFAAANTAVPTANQDQAQLGRVEKFLQSGFMRVDIFAVTPVSATKELEMRRSSNDAPVTASTFAVGEEAEQHGPAFLRNVSSVAAPLDRGERVFEPGSRVRVDVVVRTLKIGHFFPGGTVDAQEVWVELKGTDSTGKVVFWSGKTAESGKGPVDAGAHFYQSVQLDADGNVINKRNAFQTRGLFYVRLIPPGAADVVHYLVTIPKDVRGPITLEAKLNYRKFTYFFSQYAYAGKPKPGQDPGLVDVNHDSREWGADPHDIPSDVSGAIKGRIPDLPIVTIAASSQQLQTGASSNKEEWASITSKADYQRWNDYGIGLLLQGDLKGAEYAFQKVTLCDPAYSDGYLNIARALIQEGEVDRAQPFVQKAIQLNPGAGRNYYFLGLIQKTQGNYDGALKSFQTTAKLFPRDRVVLDQMGRIYFLKRDYQNAVNVLDRVLGVDPEDLQCHYNLMLCMRALGKTEEADREEKLFRRFKADESATTVAQKLVSANPEMNNSRQPIHDHVSIALNDPAQTRKSSQVVAPHIDTARELLGTTGGGR